MPLRWGILTAARISNDFVNAFNTYPDKGDQQIVGIAARDKSRAADFAKLHNIPKVYDSYQALVTSKDIDVVYIGALHPDHYPLAKLCLENKKHVLCEKPLCMNYKQTKSLVDLSKKNRLFLMEAVWSRCHPAYASLENEISSGKLGDIKFVEANFGITAPGVDRLSKKELGGSSILDPGIYVLQLAQFVFKDEPLEVRAFGEVNENGVDVSETVILDYSGGRRAVLNVHTNLQLWNNGTVVGTKGRTTLKDPFHTPTELIHADGTVEKFSLHKSNLPYNFVNSPALVYEAMETARCIKEGLLESPRMTHKDSLVLAKLEDTIRKQIGVHFDVDDVEFS